MTTKTQSPAEQWAKTHKRYQARPRALPAYDPYAGSRVLFIEFNIKHARPERPLGDLAVAEGDVFYAHPGTPEIRKHLGQGTIVELHHDGPAPDSNVLATDTLEGVLADRPLISKLRGLGYETGDDLASGYLSGALRSQVSRKAQVTIGDSLVTAGLITPDQLAA